MKRFLVTVVLIKIVTGQVFQSYNNLAEHPLNNYAGYRGIPNGGFSNLPAQSLPRNNLESNRNLASRVLGGDTHNVNSNTPETLAVDPYQNVNYNNINTVSANSNPTLVGSLSPFDNGVFISPDAVVTDPYQIVNFNNMNSAYANAHPNLVGSLNTKAYNNLVGAAPIANNVETKTTNVLNNANNLKASANLAADVEGSNAAANFVTNTTEYNTKTNNILAALAATFASGNPNVATFNLGRNGNVFTVTSGSPGTEPLGMQVLAEALEVGGTVAVTGQMPIYGTVAVNGNIPTEGIGSVSYNMNKDTAVE